MSSNTVPVLEHIYGEEHKKAIYIFFSFQVTMPLFSVIFTNASYLPYLLYWNGVIPTFDIMTWLTVTFSSFDVE
jgi:hypothetical protein